jgi:hypothetical protein
MPDNIGPKWFIFWARFNAVFLGYEFGNMLFDFKLISVLFAVIFYIGMKINWDRYMMFPERERNK